MVLSIDIGVVLTDEVIRGDLFDFNKKVVLSI